MIDSFRFTRFSVLSGVLVAAIGGLGLIGWAIDNPYLKSVDPNFVSMKPNTAVGLLIAGLVLLLRQCCSESRRLERATQILALTVVAVGLLSLSQYALGVDWQIDQFLFADAPNAVRTVHLGRMAPTTAFLFLFLGASMLKSRSQLGSRVTQVGSTFGLAISMFVLVGYAYQVEGLQGIAAYTPMAVHTATAFLFLSLGTFCLDPDKGIVRFLRQPTPGAVMLRFMLPAAILLPLILGWLRLQGQAVGLYDVHFGVSLFALSMVVAFAASLVGCAITMDRLDEKRRRASEELDQFFDVSLDLLCIAGTDGLFKRINRTWSRTLGHSTKELLSTPYFDFVHPEDREQTIAAASKLAAGADVTSFENRYRKRDGTYVWLNWVARAPDNTDGHIFAIARDLTEKKLHEEQMRRLNAELEEKNRQAREANHELESFSYSVSHDLRTPLRSLDGFSRAMLEDYGDKLDATAMDYLHRIRAGAQRMGALIDDLLQLSRMTRMEMHSRKIDLASLSNSLVRELQRQYSERIVDVLIDKHMTAHGDPLLMQAVLQNLIGNAWKYTSQISAAQIRIGRLRKGDEDIFFVKDNGAGFDMAYVDKLFGPFQRLHSSDEFEGNGIGLATVQRIIHRHGGRVWTEGIVNGGATFYFTLPHAAKEGEFDEGQNNPAGGRQRGRCGIDHARVEAEQYQQ